MPRHPYTQYEGTPLWRATKKALADLEQNEDLAFKTSLQYVVGYLCKQLATKGLVRGEGLRKNRRAGSQAAAAIARRRP